MITKNLKKIQFPGSKTVYNLGFYPEIIVSTTAGSTIKCINASINLTQTADENGKSIFRIPSYGTWILTAEKDTKTSAEISVVVDTVKQYTIELTIPVE